MIRRTLHWNDWVGAAGLVLLFIGAFALGWAADSWIWRGGHHALAIAAAAIELGFGFMCFATFVDAVRR